MDKNGKPTLIIKYINELLDKGIKGNLRKEAVVSTLQELVVSARKKCNEYFLKVIVLLKFEISVIIMISKCFELLSREKKITL